MFFCELAALSWYWVCQYLDSRLPNFKHWDSCCLNHLIHGVFYNHLKRLRHLITLSGLLLSETYGSDFELKETAHNHIASEQVRIYLTFVLLQSSLLVTTSPNSSFENNWKILTFKGKKLKSQWCIYWLMLAFSVYSPMGSHPQAPKPSLLASAVSTDAGSHTNPTFKHNLMLRWS